MRTINLVDCDTYQAANQATQVLLFMQNFTLDEALSSPAICFQKDWMTEKLSIKAYIQISFTGQGDIATFVVLLKAGLRYLCSIFAKHDLNISKYHETATSSKTFYYVTMKVHPNIFFLRFYPKTFLICHSIFHKITLNIPKRKL